MDVMLVPGPPGTLTPPLSDPETRTIDDEELKRELAFELHSDPITSIEDHDEEEATNRNMDGAGDGPPSPVEEEIVPDHYYGGQVPVFKPVRLGDLVPPLTLIGRLIPVP